MQAFATDAEVLARLEACRVPSAPVLDPTEAGRHPFFVERRAVREIDDPRIGKLTVPGFPFKFSDAPAEGDLVTHALGEDNEYVLRDLLGYDDRRIEELRAAGVIAEGAH